MCESIPDESVEPVYLTPLFDSAAAHNMPVCDQDDHAVLRHLHCEGDQARPGVKVRRLRGRGLRELRRLRASAGRVLDPPGLILLYHRVAHPDIDPRRISVRPERFEEHLEVLRRLARPVPLNQIAPGKQAGRPYRQDVRWESG